MKDISGKIICWLFFTLLMGCSSEEKIITLKEWIENNNVYSEYITQEADDCKLTETVYNRLTLDEFKIKLYGDLANCSLENKEKLKKYLIKRASSGLHPKRIDSVKYSSVFSEIKEQLIIEYRNFWQKKDTSYFSEIEKRVNLDQRLYWQDLSDSTNFTAEKRISVFEENTRYLLDYCKKNGFPFKPNPSNFDSFRTRVDPSVIAIHASHKDKTKLLQYAIESAEKGIISWHDPISICVTFHTNSVDRKSVKPIFFIFFDKDAHLDLTKSYLQLYSILKLYDISMKVPIRIQPSKYNYQEKSTIVKQLKEIKESLVNEFSFDSNNIVISDSPDDNEQQPNELPDYKFTLTEIIQNGDKNL